MFSLLAFGLPKVLHTYSVPVMQWRWTLNWDSSHCLLMPLLFQRFDSFDFDCPSLEYLSCFKIIKEILKKISKTKQ